jgi:hypothetical protein
MIFDNMCKNLFFLLIIFTFIQIQLSWRRDEVITNKPWMVLWRGYTEDCSVETGHDFYFNAFSTKYGYPLINITDNYIKAIDRTEIEINAIVKVYGPPLSFHRIVMIMNDKAFRTLDVLVPYSGVAHNSMLSRIILPPGSTLRIHHYFDSIWNKVNISHANISMSFRSGIPNLYDSPWVYK